MKQLDKTVESKLTWLGLPLYVVGIFFVIDMCLDFRMNSINWIMPIMFGCSLIPLIGFSIAYIKYKCWGLLLLALALTLIMVLNMSNFFIDLLFH